MINQIYVTFFQTGSTKNDIQVREISIHPGSKKDREVYLVPKKFWHLNNHPAISKLIKLSKLKKNCFRTVKVLLIKDGKQTEDYHR